MFCLVTFDNPIITQVTPALFFALFAHLNEVYAKYISIFLANILSHSNATCCPWVIELVDTKASLLLEFFIYLAPK